MPTMCLRAIGAIRRIFVVTGVFREPLVAAWHAARILCALGHHHLPVENKGHSQRQLPIAAPSSTVDRKQVLA
jgi:hypothetical protein